MSYHVQVEPEEVHKYKAETKRQSLYHYIRHASKIMKRCTHIKSFSENLEEDLNEKHLIDEDISSYYQDVNEKESDMPSSWSNRHSSQLAFPPNSFISTPPPPPMYIKTDLNFDDEEEDLVHHDDLYTDSNCYSTTLQKLCGVSLTKDTNVQSKTNTAVLITLSSSALAAANAARQRRQKKMNL